MGAAGALEVVNGILLSQKGVKRLGAEADCFQLGAH
jgi:hypothetical protein